MRVRSIPPLAALVLFASVLSASPASADHGVPPPSNDGIAAPVVLDGSDFHGVDLTLDVRHATWEETTDPHPCLRYAQPEVYLAAGSVWFELTPDRAMDLRSSFEFSRNEGGMIVFQGGTGGARVVDGCQFDTDYRDGFSVEAGQRYLIVLFTVSPRLGYPEDVRTNERVSLTIAEVVSPARADDFADAEDVELPFAQISDVPPTSLEVGETDADCGGDFAQGSVWYRVSTDVQRSITVRGWLFNVWTGTSLTSLHHEFCNQSGGGIRTYTVLAQPGTTYYVQLLRGDDFLRVFETPPIEWQGGGIEYPHPPYAGEPQTVCAYWGRYSAGPATVTWDPGDGSDPEVTSGEGQSCIEHTYAAAGTYLVTVHIEEPDLRELIRTFEVTLYDPPPPMELGPIEILTTYPATGSPYRACVEILNEDPGIYLQLSHTWTFTNDETGESSQEFRSYEYGSPLCVEHWEWGPEGTYSVRVDVESTTRLSASATGSVRIGPAHEIEVVRLGVPTTAVVGSTAQIGVDLRTRNYPEVLDVFVFVCSYATYGCNQFAIVEGVAVPRTGPKRTSRVKVPYTFTEDDRLGSTVVFSAYAVSNEYGVAGFGPDSSPVKVTPRRA